MVGGSVVNYFGFQGANPASGEGIRAWYGSGLSLDFQAVG